MAWTDEIAKDMGISMETVNTISEEIGVRGKKYRYGFYGIEDNDVPKLKRAILKWKEIENLKRQKEQVLKYIDKFGVDSLEANEIAKEYKMEHFIEEQKRGDPLKLKIEELELENQSLKSQLLELQEKLDKIAKEKLETAEIVARIGEKYLK